MRFAAWTAMACALALTAPTLAFAQTPISQCSRTEADGVRTLCHEAVLDAPVSDVWRLWTTADGLRTWAAPVVAIDVRPGGLWETSYNPSAHIGDAGNIRNRIIASQPNAMLIMQVAAAPPGFAHPTEVRALLTVIEIDPVDATHTHVRIAMHGYRPGTEFDDLYRFFERGNAYSLEKLQQRIATGPVDWNAETAAQNATR